MTPTQTHAALLSDAEIAQCINQSRTNLFDRAGTTSFRIARAIEQALLAKLQPAQAGELPDDSIPAIGCGFWIDRISVENLRRIHRSESATAMISALINATDAIEDAQALISSLRAALAARKPLTLPTPSQLEAEFDRRNEELERVGHGTDVPNDLWDFSIGARFGIEEFCRINGLEVKT